MTTPLRPEVHTNQPAIICPHCSHRHAPDHGHIEDGDGWSIVCHACRRHFMMRVNVVYSTQTIHGSIRAHLGPPETDEHPVEAQ